jgi:lipopolysaccharide/colanic/teichoic acid biosynthesis glycosyltransferase
MLKRLFDIFFAFSGIFFLSPLFLLVAIWIKKDSPGPVIFRQDRVGRKWEIFKIYKFRTMRPNPDNLGSKLTVGKDARITESGTFLRKYKIDELPQLLNVLKGEMSLVGPRPEVEEYVRYYPSDIREKVLSVKPGITDLASIEYVDESSILAQSDDPYNAYINKVLPQKLQYCVRYVEERNLMMDLLIILKTITKIICG